MKINRKILLHGALYFLAGLAVSCALLIAISYYSNRGLPTGPEELDQLDPLDKARLAETLHLKNELGDTVWEGWGRADIPIIIWNQEYEFLIGPSQPPPGWEAVPGDTFQGKMYFRREAEDPQNFAVRVGEDWAASMATKYETDAFIQGVFRDILPSPLEGVFPYRLLILPSEVQISAVLHESFHVYQTQTAPNKFELAEAVYPYGERYWALDEDMHAAWEAEMGILVEALEAITDDQAAELSRQFLAKRDQRRAEHDVDTELVDFERYLEWLEGLAKYVELAIWREADLDLDYQPLPEIQYDPDFKGYDTFERRWSDETSQMGRQATQEDDTRFYYTGMVQAHLLERLTPDWMSRAMEPGVFLEDLLREEVE